MSHPLPEATTAVSDLSPSRCPSCGADVTPEASFCEACGSPLTAPAAAAAAASLAPPSPRCLECGGEVGTDGYCTVCGTKAPAPRDHYVEQPASWVAAVCDRGIKHHRNEDATAVAAQAEPGSRAVLVVCDGVSTSTDSDVASLAAARRARDVLVALQPDGLGTPASQAAAIAAAFETAAAQANEAVVQTTASDSDNAAACTFAAAVVQGDLVVHAGVGDSRVYWLPDGDAPPLQLTVDDSMAQARIEMGVAREAAETGPQAHAITRWLGRDTPDAVPRTGTLALDRPGWLLVCSDGLWNYASTPERLQALVAELAAGAGSPLALAEALVRWANAQGGRDNVSVALARH